MLATSRRYGQGKSLDQSKMTALAVVLLRFLGAFEQVFAIEPIQEPLLHPRCFENRPTAIRIVPHDAQVRIGATDRASDCASPVEDRNRHRWPKEVLLDQVALSV